MNKKIDINKPQNSLANRKDSQRLQETVSRTKARMNTSPFLHANEPNIEDDIAYNNSPDNELPIGAIAPEDMVTNVGGTPQKTLSKNDGLKDKKGLKDKNSLMDKGKEKIKNKAAGAAVTAATGGAINGKLAEKVGEQALKAVGNYKQKLKRKIIFYGVIAGISALIMLIIVAAIIGAGQGNRAPYKTITCDLTDMSNKELVQYLYNNNYCQQENCEYKKGTGPNGDKYEDPFVFFKGFKKLLNEKIVAKEESDGPLLYETVAYNRGDDELFQLRYHEHWYWWLDEFFTKTNTDDDGETIDPDIADMLSEEKELSLLTDYMYEWVKSEDVTLADKLLALINGLASMTDPRAKKIFERILGTGEFIKDKLTDDEKTRLTSWFTGASYEDLMLFDEYDRATGTKAGAAVLTALGFKKVFSINRYVGYLKYGKDLKQVTDKNSWPTAESLEYTTNTTYTGPDGDTTAVSTGYIYNRLLSTKFAYTVGKDDVDWDLVERSVIASIQEIFNHVQEFYGCTKAICKPCGSDDGGGSGICSDISLTSTSLSKEEFISLTQEGMKSYSKEGASKISENAGLIYDISITKNFNPELVVIRAVVEGFSPGNNNYWGLNCPNGADCSGRTYHSIEAGVKAFIDVMQGYGTNNLLEIYSVHHYAYIGSYWLNPGGSGSGGCYYYSHIKKYMSEERSNQVGNACSQSNKCSGSSCLKTNDEDQLAYSKFQVQKMLDIRKAIYKLDAGTCDDSESTKIPTNDRLKYLFPDGVPTTKTEMEKYLTTITIPILNESGESTTMNLTVHNKLSSNFMAAFTEIKNSGFKIKKSTTAAFVWRSVSGTSKLSAHSYGAAVDINREDNPICNTKSVPCGKYNPGVNEYSIPKSIANILESHGLLWGLWEGNRYPGGVKYDYMHFSYTGT